MINAFFTFIILFSCLTGTEEQKTSAYEKGIFKIDTDRSVVRWKGTKMKYTGSHEGTIRFRSGELEFNEHGLVSGEFVIDMKSIEVTDIPEHEPVPRKNLKDHLEADFSVSQYSTATLSIKPTTSVASPDRCGNLTIKGSTREVCFKPTQVNSKSWSTKLVILRNDFGIGEQGSWLERRLVDQEIELSVEVVVQ